MTDIQFCQSCGMPLQGEEDFGTDAGGNKNKEYCAYCYKEGAFTTEMTLEEMIENNMQYLDHYRDENGKAYTEAEVRTMLTEWMPKLKRWQKK